MKGNATIAAHRVLKNALWGVLSLGLPIPLSLILVPLLLEGLGAAQFGALSLCWIILSNTGLFDFGLSRATTRAVAEELVAGRHRRVEQLVWTSLLAQFTSATGLGCILVGFSGAIASVFVPETSSAHAAWAVTLVGLGLPVSVCAAGLRGVLEAHGRFDLVARIRLPAAVGALVLPTLTTLGGLGLIGAVASSSSSAPWRCSGMPR